MVMEKNEKPSVTASHILVPTRRTERYAATDLRVVLSSDQAQALRDILDGLLAMGASLGSGLFVERHSHAVAWLLENVKTGSTDREKSLENENKILKARVDELEKQQQSGSKRKNS